MHALVSGAGIAGLSFAAAFTRLGHRVTLVEQAPELRAVGAGIVLAPNATSCLAWAGVSLEGLGRSVRSFALQDLQGRSLGQAGELPSEHPTLAVHRGQLLERLAVASSDAERLFARTLTHLDGGRVTLDDGRELQPDVVIAADGLHSGVRSLLLGDAGPKLVSAGHACWRGLFPLQESTPDQPVEIWGRGSRAGLVPLADGLGYLYLVENGDGEGMDTRFGDYPLAVRQAIAATERFHKADLASLEPHCFAHGSVAFLGDAAHALTPNMGQGACMAIEDAVVLAWLLNEQGVDGIGRYAELRKARVRWVADSSERIGRIGQWEGPLACSLRDWILRMTPQSAGQQVADRLWTRSPVALGLVGP